jgi:hypothetical protein
MDKIIEKYEELSDEELLTIVGGGYRWDAVCQIAAPLVNFAGQVFNAATGN